MLIFFLLFLCHTSNSVCLYQSGNEHFCTNQLNSTICDLINGEFTESLFCNTSRACCDDGFCNVTTIQDCWTGFKVLYIDDPTCDAVECAVCGNGILQVGEECDDGNTVSGDGCSSTCVEESICVSRFFTCLENVDANICTNTLLGFYIKPSPMCSAVNFSYYGACCVESNNTCSTMTSSACCQSTFIFGTQCYDSLCDNNVYCDDVEYIFYRNITIFSVVVALGVCCFFMCVIGIFLLLFFKTSDGNKRKRRLKRKTIY